MESSKETQMFVAEVKSATTVEEVLEIVSEVVFGTTQEACNVRGFNVCGRTVMAAAAARLSLKEVVT